MKKESGNSKYHVPNLERALEIFELLARHAQGLTLSEISNLLKFSRNSVYRITSTLLASGFLNRNKETKTFYLSLKLLSVGIKALNDPPLVEQSLPIMHKLQEKYKETVPLGILRGNMGVVLETVVGSHLFRYILEPGKIFHLHTSAPGKAIMAFLPIHECEELIKKINYQKFNIRTIRNPLELYKALDEVRKNGYAVDNAEEIEGMHCIGAPIFNRKGYPVAAIWITGPSMRIKHEDFHHIGIDIKHHAELISKRMSYDPTFENITKSVTVYQKVV